MNSDGWIEPIPGKIIQDLAPFVIGAILAGANKTTINNKIPNKYRNGVIFLICSISNKKINKARMVPKLNHIICFIKKFSSYCSYLRALEIVTQLEMASNIMERTSLLSKWLSANRFNKFHLSLSLYLS